MKELPKFLIVLALISNVLCIDIGSLLGLRRNWQDDLSHGTINPEIVEIVRWRQPVCVVPGPDVPACLTSLRKYQDEYERISSDRADDNPSIEAKSAPAVEMQFDEKTKRHVGHYHTDRVARILTPTVTDRIHVDDLRGPHIESSEGPIMDYHLVIGSGTPSIDDARSQRDGRYLVISSLEKKKVPLSHKPPAISVTKVLNSPVTATLVAKNCFPDIGVPLCDDYHETLTIFKNTAAPSIADKQDHVRPFSEYFDNIHKFGGSSHGNRHGVSSTSQLSFEVNKSVVKNNTGENEKPEGLLAQTFPHVFNRPTVAQGVPPEIVNIVISTPHVPAAGDVNKSGAASSASASASFSSSVHPVASFPPFRQPGASFSSSLNAGASFSSSVATGASSSLPSNTVTTIHQTEIKPHVSITKDETARPIEIVSTTPKPGLISSLLNVNKPSIFAGFGFSFNKYGASTDTPIVESTVSQPADTYGPPDAPVKPADTYGPPADPVKPADTYGPPADPVKPADTYGPPADPVKPADTYLPPTAPVKPADTYGPPDLPTSTSLPADVSESPEVTRKPIVQTILGIFKHKPADSNESIIHDIRKKPIIQAINGIFHRPAITGELSVNITKNAIVQKTEGTIVKPDVIRANETDLKPIIVVQPTKKPGLLDHLWNTKEGILDKLSLHKASSHSGKITLKINEAQPSSSESPFVEVPEKTKFSEIFFKPENDISGRPSLDRLFDRTDSSQKNPEDRVAPPTKAPGIFGELFANPSRPTDVDGTQAGAKHIFGYGSSIFSRAPNKPLVIERPGTKPLLVEKPIYLTEKPVRTGGFFNFYVPTDDKPILNVDHDVIKEPVYVYEKPQTSGIIKNIFGSAKPFELFRGWAIFKNKEIIANECKDNCTIEKNFREISAGGGESTVTEETENTTTFEELPASVDDNIGERSASSVHEEFSGEKIQPEEPVESEHVPNETERVIPTAVTMIEEFSVDGRDNTEGQSVSTKNAEFIDENEHPEKSVEDEEKEAEKSVEDEKKEAKKSVEDEIEHLEKSVVDEKKQAEKTVKSEKITEKPEILRSASSEVDVVIEKKSLNTEDGKFIDEIKESEKSVEIRKISKKVIDIVHEKIVDAPEIELPTHNDTIITLVEDKPKNSIEKSALPVEGTSGENAHESSHESAKTLALAESLGKTITEEPVVDNEEPKESANFSEVDADTANSEESIIDV